MTAGRRTKRCDNDYAKVTQTKTAGSWNHAGRDHHCNRNRRNFGKYSGHDDRTSALCRYAEGGQDAGFFPEPASGEDHEQKRESVSVYLSFDEWILCEDFTGQSIGF